MATSRCRCDSLRASIMHLTKTFSSSIHKCFTALVECSLQADSCLEVGMHTVVPVRHEHPPVESTCDVAGWQRLTQHGLLVTCICQPSVAFDTVGYEQAAVQGCLSGARVLQQCLACLSAMW